MNDYAIITGGDYSTLTGGRRSKLSGGERSVLTGGEYSVLTWDWWDDDTDRQRRTTVYVGEDGIEPNVTYKCVKGKVMRAEDEK